MLWGLVVLRDVIDNHFNWVCVCVYINVMDCPCFFYSIYIIDDLGRSGLHTDFHGAAMSGPRVDSRPGQCMKSNFSILPQVWVFVEPSLFPVPLTLVL